MKENGNNHETDTEHQKIRRPSNSLSFNADSDAAPSQGNSERHLLSGCVKTKTEHSTQQQHQQSQNKRYRSKTGRQTLQIKTGTKTVRDPSREQTTTNNKNHQRNQNTKSRHQTLQ